MGTDLQEFNNQALDLAIDFGAKARFEYPEHGYGTPVDRVVRPTEYTDDLESVVCDTEDGIKSFRIDKIVGSVLVKP